jgi:hypothetical protein
MSFWDRVKEWLEKTFGPEGLFSSGQEGHAFLIGISETVAFWKPRFDMPPAWYKVKTKAVGISPGNPLYEYHYYMFGRAMGVLVWIGLSALIKVIWF